MYARIGVSGTIYVNIDSPNLGFPYFRNRKKISLEGFDNVNLSLNIKQAGTDKLHFLRILKFGLAFLAFQLFQKFLGSRWQLLQQKSTSFAFCNACLGNLRCTHLVWKLVLVSYLLH